MSHKRPLQFPFGYATVLKLFITAANLRHTNRNAPRGLNLPELEFCSLQIPRFGAPPHSSPIRYQIFGNVSRHKCQRNLLRVWLVVSCIVLTQPPICIFYLHAGSLSGGKIAGHTLPNYLVLAVLAMVAGLCGARGTGYQEPFTAQAGTEPRKRSFSGP